MMISQKVQVCAFVGYSGFALCAGCGGESPKTSDTDGWDPSHMTDDPGELPTTGGGDDPCVFSNYAPGIYNFKCDNSGSPKNTASLGSGAGDGEYFMPYVNACADVEPGGDPMVLDAAVRAKCTVVCGDVGYTPRECFDNRWSAWTPVGIDACKPQVCSVESRDLDLDLIEDRLGSETAEDVMDFPCQLPFDCIDYLTPLEISGMYSEPVVDLEDTAASQAVANAGHTGVTILGAEQSVPTSVSLGGAAAFSATSCGADACPFYLAQLDLAAASSFNVTLEYSSTTVTKSLSGFTMGLDHPALGIWVSGTGAVIFPPNSLVMRVGTTISGTPEYFSENGVYDNVYPVGGYVFGYYDQSTGEFTIEASGESVLGTWGLTAQFFT